MQEITIFFSWQSERQNVSSHIECVLTECAKELGETLTINVQVIDADKENRGSYDINNAVLNAIEGSDVIVADLTPTSYGNDGRANPNANALYEYATARAKKGPENVLAIADISQDNIKQFPFDFNHNSIVTFNGTADKSFKASLMSALEKVIRAKVYPILTETTTVFFAQRIAQSFPGVRNLKVYEDPIEIHRHLDAFFAHPIAFGEAIDREGDSQPLWWFRGGMAEAINSYERQPNGITHIGWNELKIRRIVVYSNTGQYYSEYLYIEAEAMTPTNLNSPTDEQLKCAVGKFGYCSEEYAVVKQGDFEYKITRQQYDDGYAEVNGKIVPIRNKAALRCRYLSPFNFIVAAKFGAYNCNEFCRTSQEYFDALLKGQIEISKLHEYLMTFPKPRHTF